MDKMTYGYMVTTRDFAGSDAIQVNVMCRRNEQAHPLNCSGDGEQSYNGAPARLNGLHLCDLQIRLWRLDDRSWTGAEVEYRNTFSIDLRKAKQMAKTLAKIQKAIDDSNAVEAGDVIMAVAKALGLGWTAISNDENYGTYQETTWRFRPVTYARDQVRDIVAVR